MTIQLSNTKRCAAAALLSLAVAVAPQSARADEGGVSFWLPGQFGSLAATPGVPGWAFAVLYIHPSVNAGAGASFPRGGRIDLGINGRGDLVAFGPTYTFATLFLGAQVSASLLGIAGRNEGSVTASLTGPLGNTISGSRTQALTSFGDVIPQVTLKWNQGVHNFMTYVMGDIPVGDYDPARLANLGIGHGAADWGGGYTYFNPQTGNEFSGTAGFTYNFINPDTQYKNGIDFHFDWGASHFLSKQVFVGLVGYAYVAAYCAAKHGLIGLTRALALEFAKTGITVNAVCPGFTETPLVARAVETIVAKTGRSEELAKAELVKSNPQGRLVQPEEVADAVLWLASPGAASINGQAIVVAGGEVMAG